MLSVVILAGVFMSDNGARDTVIVLTMFTVLVVGLVTFAFGAILAIAAIAYAWDHLHIDLCELKGLIGADGERSNVDVLRAILQVMGEPADTFDWMCDPPAKEATEARHKT